MWPKIMIGIACLAGLTGCSINYYITQPEDGVSTPATTSYAEPAAEEASVTLALILPAGIADPGPSYIWVEPYPLQEDVAVPGFWRLRERLGFTWVVGFWEGDSYIPGYWKPLKHKGSQWAWVPGHWWGKHWIEGKWRPVRRTGYSWVPGHWTRGGEWNEGFWRPAKALKPNTVWVPGYWGPNDDWKEGYWRPEHRDGYVWIGGYYNGQGLWVAGQWQAAPPAYRWSPGYWDPKGMYTPGRLERDRDDAEYVPGHYDRGSRWAPEQWKGRAPQTQLPPQNPQQPQQVQQIQQPGHQVPLQPIPQPQQPIQQPNTSHGYQQPSPDQQPDSVGIVPPTKPGVSHGRGGRNTESPESDRGLGRDKVREADQTSHEGLHLGQQRRQEVGQRAVEEEPSQEEPAWTEPDSGTEPAQESGKRGVKRNKTKTRTTIDQQEQEQGGGEWKAKNRGGAQQESIQEPRQEPIDSGVQERGSKKKSESQTGHGSSTELESGKGRGR